MSPAAMSDRPAPLAAGSTAEVVHCVPVRVAAITAFAFGSPKTTTGALPTNAIPVGRGWGQPLHVPAVAASVSDHPLPFGVATLMLIPAEPFTPNATHGFPSASSAIPGRPIGPAWFSVTPKL